MNEQQEQGTALFTDEPGPICSMCKHPTQLMTIGYVCPNPECPKFRQRPLDGPTAPTNDPVNHPKHYTSHPSGVECITVTEHFNFNVGNAIKYLWRCGLKEATPSLIDLKKAQWYVNREIERLEKKTNGA